MKKLLVQQNTLNGRNKHLKYLIEQDEEFECSYNLEVIESEGSCIITKAKVNIICKYEFAIKLLCLMYKNGIYPVHVKDVLDDIGVRCVSIYKMGI